MNAHQTPALRTPTNAATSDRELLEAAARAVGFIDDATSDDNSFGLHRAPDGVFYESDANGWTDWEPQHDDGQALRLAVKLEIEIRVFNGAAHAGKQDKFWCTENWFPDGNPCAATRRAIVRAAAALPCNTCRWTRMGAQLERELKTGAWDADGVPTTSPTQQEKPHG